MATNPFDYAQIEATWETYPTVRVRFADDESGWAKQLDAQHVLLCNLPLAEGLCFMDICTTRRGRHTIPTIATVIQRRYTQRALVRYVPPEDLGEAELRAQYVIFSKAIHAAGCAAEGMAIGTTLVNAPDDCDVAAVAEAAAAEAGFTIEAVVVEGADED